MDPYRAQTTRTINQIFGQLAENISKASDKAPVEEKELLTRAQFLAGMVGRPQDPDEPAYTEAQAQAAVEQAHNEWKEENNG